MPTTSAKNAPVVSTWTLKNNAHRSTLNAQNSISALSNAKVATVDIPCCKAAANCRQSTRNSKSKTVSPTILTISAFNALIDFIYLPISARTLVYFARLTISLRDRVLVATLTLNSRTDNVQNDWEMIVFIYFLLLKIFCLICNFITKKNMPLAVFVNAKNCTPTARKPTKINSAKTINNWE